LKSSPFGRFSTEEYYSHQNGRGLIQKVVFAAYFSSHWSYYKNISTHTSYVGFYYLRPILDKDPRPKSGKLRLNLHGTCFGGKINWFGPKKQC
jgi:hypothetical protein